MSAAGDEATARERGRIDGGGYRRDHPRALTQRVEAADGEVRRTLRISAAPRRFQGFRVDLAEGRPPYFGRLIANFCGFFA